MSNVSTFFGPTMPGTSTTPDLDTVMAEGNSTSYAYYGTGMGMGTTVVTGPTVYSANDGDYAIICDCSSGNVRINLDPGLPNMFYIKMIGNPIGVNVNIFVLGSGSIDGFNPLILYRENEAVLVVKNGANDYAIVGSHLSIGTVNSGNYTNSSFNGTIIKIPHNLNSQPTSGYIMAGNSATSSLLAGGYFLSFSDTEITVTLSTVALAVSLQLFHTVTRNNY